MNKNISKIASEFGKMGAKVLHEKYGSDHFRNLQKKSVEAKLKKKETLLNEAKLVK